MRTGPPQGSDGKIDAGTLGQGRSGVIWAPWGWGGDTGSKQGGVWEGAPDEERSHLDGAGGESGGGDAG